MQFQASSSYLQPLPNRQRSTSHYQPISVFTLAILQTSTVSTGTALGLHPFPSPTPQKRQGKSTTTPSEPATTQLHISNICILWQILSAIRPPSPSVWLPCVISILSKSPKNNHQGEGVPAAVAAGLFQEIDADIGLPPETRTVSAQDPSRDQGVVPGLMRGNEDVGLLICRIVLWL